eukprot:1159701-Pelagomonas_calceolata.AAC.2
MIPESVPSSTLRTQGMLASFVFWVYSSNRAADALLLMLCRPGSPMPTTQASFLDQAFDRTASVPQSRGTHQRLLHAGHRVFVHVPHTHDPCLGASHHLSRVWRCRIPGHAFNVCVSHLKHLKCVRLISGIEMLYQPLSKSHYSSLELRQTPRDLSSQQAGCLFYLTVKTAHAAQQSHEEPHGMVRVSNKE